MSRAPLPSVGGVGGGCGMSGARGVLWDSNCFPARKSCLTAAPWSPESATQVRAVGYLGRGFVVIAHAIAWQTGRLCVALRPGAWFAPWMNVPTPVSARTTALFAAPLYRHHRCRPPLLVRGSCTYFGRCCALPPVTTAAGRPTSKTHETVRSHLKTRAHAMEERSDAKASWICDYCTVRSLHVPTGARTQPYFVRRM
jgi:hypothetical protein